MNKHMKLWKRIKDILFLIFLLVKKTPYTHRITLQFTEQLNQEKWVITIKIKKISMDHKAHYKE